MTTLRSATDSATKSAFRLALTAGLVAAGFLLRVVVETLFHHVPPPFITFAPAVIFSALFFDFWAGVFGTILSTLIVVFWIEYSPNIAGRIIDCSLFFVTGIGVCWLISRSLRDREFAKAGQQQAVDLIQENKRKDRLMAMLGHELRNPLSAILSGCEILLKSDLAQDTKEIAGIIFQQTKHTAKLVADVLDVSRIREGKMSLKLTCMDMTQVVKSACDSHAHLFRDRPVEFKVSLPEEGIIRCTMDQTRVTQMIGNLLNNARKFTDKGTVSVTLTADDDFAYVAVQDTGIGIDESLLPTIFQPFVQGKQGLARVAGGLGLGLALVETLAKLQGGNVSVSSRVNAGSTFTISIPLCRYTDVACAPVSRIKVGLHKLKILAIEDSEPGLQMLHRLLVVLGQPAVEVAENGLVGIEKAHSFVPDVILCDIGLPDIDGYEVARRIKQEHRLRHTTLVAVTGYGSAEDVSLAKQAGFDRHVTKPITSEQLVEILTAAADRVKC